MFYPGLKMDEESIENGLEGQECLVMCLFWGGCHHSNVHFSRRPITEKGIVDDVTMTSYNAYRNMPPSLMHIRNHHLIYWSFSSPKIGPIAHIKVYRLCGI